MTKVAAVVVAATAVVVVVVVAEEVVAASASARSPAGAKTPRPDAATLHGQFAAGLKPGGSIRFAANTSLLLRPYAGGSRAGFAGT